jgi:hypothetical protein
MSWTRGSWTSGDGCRQMLGFLAFGQVIADQPGAVAAGLPGDRPHPPAPSPPPTPGSRARPSVRPPARRFSRENLRPPAVGVGNSTLAQPRGLGSRGRG